MSENDDEILKTLEEIRERRRNRDKYYLRLSKMQAMRNLAEDFKEWIFQETKDLLIVLEILKSTGNQGIMAEMDVYEKRIKEIQRTYIRKVITPMKKIGRGSSGVHTEEEHCRKFRVTLDTTFGVILELQKIRENLETMVITISYIATGTSASKDTYVT